MSSSHCLIRPVVRRSPWDGVVVMITILRRRTGARAMRPPAAPAVSRVRLKTRPSFGQLIGLIQPGADHLPRVALFDQSPTRPSQAAAQVRVALQAPDLPNRVDRRFSPQVVFFLHAIE